MKVLLINGSPHVRGNTYFALNTMVETLHNEGIDAEIVHIGTRAIQGCIACSSCAETGTCAFSDPLFKLLEQKAKECDALVVGSPVYYAGPNGSLCAILDRLFFSAGRHLQFKPAAAVAVCRRSGATATFDRLNKYFTINNMPIVGSNYWNEIHGNTAEEAAQDEEGLQTMRVLGNNMAWLLKCIEKGKEAGVAPVTEKKIWTNFVR